MGLIQMAIQMENQEAGKAAELYFLAGFQGAVQGAVLVADAAVPGRVGRVTGSGWGKSCKKCRQSLL